VLGWPGGGILDGMGWPERCFSEMTLRGSSASSHQHHILLNLTSVYRLAAYQMGRICLLERFISFALLCFALRGWLAGKNYAFQMPIHKAVKSTNGSCPSCRSLLRSIINKAEEITA